MCSPSSTTQANTNLFLSRTSSSHSSKTTNAFSQAQQQHSVSSSYNNTSNNMTILPRRRRVSFCETLNVQFVEPRTDLTTAERDAFWYKSAEIDAFHTAARTDCRNLRRATGLPASNVGPCRGLELRRSAHRQKRKLLTIQCVLMAQKRFGSKNIHQVARMAGRCSQWAAQVAHVEAQRDFIRAYADAKDVAALLPPLPAATPFPLPLKGANSKQQPKTQQQAGQKRRPSASCRRSEPDASSSERCVRRRTSVC